jgi:hypothetical protein
MAQTRAKSGGVRGESWRRTEFCWAATWRKQGRMRGQTCFLVGGNTGEKWRRMGGERGESGANCAPIKPPGRPSLPPLLHRQSGRFREGMFRVFSVSPEAFGVQRSAAFSAALPPFRASSFPTPPGLRWVTSRPSLGKRCSRCPRRRPRLGSCFCTVCRSLGGFRMEPNRPPRNSRCSYQRGPCNCSSPCSVPRLLLAFDRWAELPFDLLVRRRYQLRSVRGCSRRRLAVERTSCFSSS